MPLQTSSLRTLRLHIGRNINRMRSEKRLPLRRLSRLTGLSERLLDQYELGKNEIGLDALLKLSYALNVPIHRLVDPDANILQSNYAGV